MFRKAVVALALSVLLAPAAAFAQGSFFGDAGGAYVQQSGPGQLNWQSMKMRVSGQGAPNANAPNIAVARLGAERAAKADAFRNALETIQGVYVNSESTVQDFMLQSDTIRTRVEGVLKGFQVVDRKYFSDGGVEIIIEVPVSGEMAAALIGNQQFGQVPAAPAPGAAAPQGPVYTGLIIDARGLGAKPAMSPKVVDERGSEVYGSAMVGREFALDLGVVGYAKDLEAAKTNDRVANNALVVKATKVQGAKGTDLVLGQSDADGIRNASENLSFLSKCRVIILL
ncbi:MAG: LPP20 family lipoprotein [Bdellovibrionota bacterium]